MAITKFVPELWIAAIQLDFEKSLVYGQSSVVNRKYEGQIREQGDTVRVTTIEDPTIRAYDKTVDLVNEDVTDGEIVMTIDQGSYFNFRVNDVDRVQAAGDFRGPAQRRASYGLKDSFDAYLAGIMDAGVSASTPDNDLGSRTATSSNEAFYVLRDLEVALDEANVPTEGRWVVVDPSFHALVHTDDRFTDLSASGSGAALRNGMVGRVLGFDVLKSNNVPDDGYGEKSLIAGIPDATSAAEQIVQMEALRSELRFADNVRGLHVYGSKVFRADGLARAGVTTTLPT